MKQTTVLGAGSWGTALAWLLATNGHAVRLWSHRPEQVSEMATTRRNPDYLPTVALPDGLVPTSDLSEAVAGSNMIVLAVPSYAVRELSRDFVGSCDPGAVLVSTAKGIEQDSMQRMSEVLGTEAGGHPAVVLSGPSFASEVVANHPTAVVAASRIEDAAMQVQNAFSGDRFRVYTLTDVVGVEIGGAFKNVIAIAAGVVEGLGFGANTMAALITRGLREVSRLAVACGAQERTLSGLSGLGDLVLTCTGGLSRNKSVGLQLAQGNTLERIVEGLGQVAEGVRTTNTINALAAEHRVEVPIAATMDRVLREDQSVEDAIRELMSRASKGEFE